MRARASFHARWRSRIRHSIEELLLRHALGESSLGWARESQASGVMMIPIPRRGIFRGVDGVDEARAVPGVDDVRITAKPDQVLVPLPEGASYLGFIFARAATPDEVERALRTAHACLEFAIDPEIAGATIARMADNCAPTPPPAPTGNKSGRKVFCVKFQKELPGLDAPPWPGELGQRIYENISAEAWKLWEDRMKMILNEYRLMPWQKEAQDLVAKHMEDFFFGEGVRASARIRAAAERSDKRREPEERQRACWYGRRTTEILPDVAFQTVEDGALLYCAHPMWFPVVGLPISTSETATAATTSRPSSSAHYRDGKQLLTFQPFCSKPLQPVESVARPR